MHDLPRYPAAPQPFPEAARPKRRKQENADDDPGRMTLRGQPLVGQRQGYAPRLDVLRQRQRCAAACITRRSRRSANCISLAFMIVYNLGSNCCRSLNNSNRLAANSLGLVLALCMANAHIAKPTARNNPASDPSTRSRYVSQNATTSRMVASTTPTPRQNKAASVNASSENKCSRSSSRSADNRQIESRMRDGKQRCCESCQ